MNSFYLAELKGRGPKEKVEERESFAEPGNQRNIPEYQVQAFSLWWIQMVREEWCIRPSQAVILMPSECEKEADGFLHKTRPQPTILHMTDNQHQLYSESSFCHIKFTQYFLKVSFAFEITGTQPTPPLFLLFKAKNISQFSSFTARMEKNTKLPTAVQTLYQELSDDTLRWCVKNKPQDHSVC